MHLVLFDKNDNWVASAMNDELEHQQSSENERNSNRANPNESETTENL
jgi:hypothetical protein